MRREIHKVKRGLHNAEEEMEEGMEKVNSVVRQAETRGNIRNLGKKF